MKDYKTLITSLLTAYEQALQGKRCLIVSKRGSVVIGPPKPETPVDITLDENV